MPGQKVVVGLSGGVDSAVCALILKKQGYEVIGAFMKNFSDTKDPLTGECNWVEEKKMAQKIAVHLKIPFIVLDFEKEYKKYVINPMIKSYQLGLTPNPDISCNTIIKFPLLWKKAKKLGADFIATGHYARIKKKNEFYGLYTGKDKNHDQSYFLYELSQNDLSHTLFPLGNYTKEQIRKIAKNNHFPNWNKKGTRGICFVGKIDFNEFIRKKTKNKNGKVLNPEGKIIGTHQSLSSLTIGQRLGPKVGVNITDKTLSGQKIYLISKDTKKNTLIAAQKGHKAHEKDIFQIKND